MDGSMATSLYEKGIFINRSFEEANLINSELVKEIHSHFINAGAKIIGTNTWAANANKLKGYGLESVAHEINRRGAQLALSIAQDKAWVAGIMGPLGLRIEPWGPTSFEEARQMFYMQAQALAEGGTDLFILESFGDINEIQQAILAIKDCGDYPIIAMMETDDDGHSLYGTPAQWFAKKLDLWGAEVIGVNGGNGPAKMLEIVKQISEVTTKPIVAKPNAGSPRVVDGRTLYMASPEYFGEFARLALQQGVRVLGGCSGTFPSHIRAMGSAFRQHHAFTFSHEIHSEESTSIKAQPVVNPQMSLWGQKLARGEFVTSVELLPPKGLDTSQLIERASACKKAGIDAINIPDGPRASARMSAMATALILEREVGIETVLHFVCRDRNLLGMQSDLLGASSLGLKNVLAVTGDPPKMGSYPNATAVFDIDAIGLVNMLSRLNSGFDLGGTSIGSSTSFSIGVGANPVSNDLPREKKRFAYKVQAGAQWAITQPIFDAQSLEQFLEFSNPLGVPIIAGIWPLMSLRNALFMANEVPGVYVPSQIISRLEKCTSSADQKKVGTQIALELCEKVKSWVAGFQVSAPFGNIEIALAVTGGGR